MQRRRSGTKQVRRRLERDPGLIPSSIPYEVEQRATFSGLGPLGWHDQARTTKTPCPSGQSRRTGGQLAHIIAHRNTRMTAVHPGPTRDRVGRRTLQIFSSQPVSASISRLLMARQGPVHLSAGHQRSNKSACPWHASGARRGVCSARIARGRGLPWHPERGGAGSRLRAPPQPRRLGRNAPRAKARELRHDEKNADQRNSTGRVAGGHR